MKAWIVNWKIFVRTNIIAKNFSNMLGVGALQFFINNFDVSLRRFKDKFLVYVFQKSARKENINMFATLSFFIFLIFY